MCHGHRNKHLSAPSLRDARQSTLPRRRTISAGKGTRERICPPHRAAPMASCVCLFQGRFVLVTALLIQNSYTLQFSHLKYLIHAFQYLCRQCNHHQSQFYKGFITSRRNLVLFVYLPWPPPSPFPSPRQPPVTVGVVLALLDISYKWNHTVCDLCLASFIQHVLFKFISVVVQISTLFFYGRAVSHTTFCLSIYLQADMWVICLLGFYE